MEREVVSISDIGGSISIIFNDGESAVFYPFAKTIYTTTSPGVLKKTLTDFKKDIVKYKWDINQLKNLWIPKKKN
jgi:hypothetical protein